MEFKNTEQWWKSKDHRGIKGTRGSRSFSLKGHAVFGVAVIGGLQWLLRVDDERIRRAPEPPVAAPPPMPTSFSYALTVESPHLKKMELEQSRPSHIPPKNSFDFEQLRNGGTYAQLSKR